MIRVYIGIALMLGLLTGVWYYGHTRYAAGVEHCHALTQAARVQAQTDHAIKMTRAASVQSHVTHAGDVKVAESTEATHETVRTIIRTVHDHPSPTACVAPADSVQALRQAVRRANAAAGQLRVKRAGDEATADPGAADAGRGAGVDGQGHRGLQNRGDEAGHHGGLP